MRSSRDFAAGFIFVYASNRSLYSHPAAWVATPQSLSSYSMLDNIKTKVDMEPNEWIDEEEMHFESLVSEHIDGAIVDSFWEREDAFSWVDSFVSTWRRHDDAVSDETQTRAEDLVSKRNTM
jgi:hypothetical protein